MIEYALSPLVKVSRLDSEGRATLRTGSGDERAHLALDGDAAQPLIEWLLGCNKAADLSTLVGSLRDCAGLDESDARDLVDNMISVGVLTDAATDNRQREQITRWGQLGWRDAADFHLATYGLRFVPDEVDGITYADYFGAMVEDTESAGEQPPAYVPAAGQRLALGAADSAVLTLDDVLSVAEPINRFDGPPVRGQELVSPLRQGFGAQRTVGGMLGEHQLRSFPSGGARHPFELYLVSKGIDDVPVGVYRFDPVEGDLYAVPGHGDAAEIDTACFGKGGIRSASAVLVLTCRWLRHSWKYRYARSYRMLLLEAGHAVQAIYLAMIRHGVQVYHCPSIHDSVIRAILAIDDDCTEGPVYALGPGHGGVR
ncbi:MAG: SagB/ThcOx family dehydrogenase [Micromonosporaceae bacterium]